MVNWTEDDVKEYYERRGIKTADQKPKPKKAKYGNKHTWLDGICFDSSMEAKYYSNLKLLLKVGAIKGFCRQPEFVLTEGNEQDRAITYSPDFIVFHNDGGFEIIDVKGMETQQWDRTFKQFRLKFPALELKVVKEV